MKVVSYFENFSVRQFCSFLLLSQMFTRMRCTKGHELTRNVVSVVLCNFADRIPSTVCLRIHLRLSFGCKFALNPDFLGRAGFVSYLDGHAPHERLDPAGSGVVCATIEERKLDAKLSLAWLES